MKLLDALKIIKSAKSKDAPPFSVALCSGFTPLHFETFLAAHISLVHPDKAVHITAGLFGDLAGNIARLDPSGFGAVIIALEWADLDARLGMRSAGGWQPEHLPDIVKDARLQLDRIAAEIQRITTRVILSTPTLPLPPVGYTSPNRLSPFEAELRLHLAGFVQRMTSAGITIISPQRVDSLSPFDARFDLKSELLTGFPYTLGHAEALARIAASATSNRVRKKGLITDLDDTLWRGILGEIGVANVCWSLDQQAQVHGVYQQFLASLAASGTLIAVASKNDPALVDETFNRDDLLLVKDHVFPFEVHWSAKSESIARILRAWNIASDSVVFIDDSPMEIAEAQAAFPDLECHLFPKDDPARLWDLLLTLREDFGADQLSEEDSLRLASLRSGVQFEGEAAAGGLDGERFLRGAEAEITLSMVKSPDPRAFELINKTNQFNLNGVRLTEADWNTILSDPERFLLKVAYKDRFGPLGTIAVLAGTAQNGTVSIDHWVMSCRAFSRRIEHQCLLWIFNRFEPEAVTLQFVPTPRNGPTRKFLESFFDRMPEPPLRLPREAFVKKCPALYHSVQELR
ncbi:MAG: HAD-IIIC family phosphatase [Acidobacteriaceae bacterium]|nr:HAD-IIIC family phosphatase [Acidobacteriaceae bacterium]